MVDNKLAWKPKVKKYFEITNIWIKKEKII